MTKSERTISSLAQGREEVQSLLSSCGIDHLSVRRADDGDYLFALPLFFRFPDRAEAFCQAAQAYFWQTKASDGWIMLDKAIGWEKQTEVFPDASAAYALLSLLARHQDLPADRRAIRLLLKAEEEGKEKLEKTCAALHAEYAQSLRLRRGIPALYPYLRNILGRQERSDTSHRKNGSNALYFKGSHRVQLS